MALVIGPATPADFMEFVGALPPYRVIARCARLDGKVVAVGGVMILPFGGGNYAFLDIAEEGRAFPKSLHREGLSFMREVRQSIRGPIAATTLTNVPRADEWLQRLGFVKYAAGGTKVFVHDATESHG